MSDISNTIEDWMLEGDNIDTRDKKIAHLVINDIIHFNNGWWVEGWPKGKVTMHVICSDVFAWGCADSEDIDYNEIDELYEMWKKDPIWGSSVWCIKKAKLWPQPPVEEIIRKLGTYDLDEILKGVPNRHKGEK